MDQVIALPLPTTPEEFLAWEQRQEGKYEFDGRTPRLVNGGTAAHARIERSIMRELEAQLAGSPFEPLPSAMKVRCGNSYRYPDASITSIALPGHSITVEQPIVLFEVVSQGSESLDHGRKVGEYCALPSLTHYVIAEQDQPLLTVHVRTPDGWAVARYGLGDTLPFPGLNILLPVAAIYRGVFPAP